VSTAFFGQEALEQKDVEALAGNVQDFLNPGFCPVLHA
jgi:hypothetical protein